MVFVLFLVLANSLFSQLVLFEKQLTSFSNSLNKYGPVELLDHNYILAAHQHDSLQIIKLSTNGDVLWFKKIFTGTSIVAGINPVCATSDSGFAVVGTTLNQKEDITLYKFSVEGILQWQKTFGDPTLPEVAFEILQTEDNNYILTAGIKDVSFTSPIIFKVDASGNQLWRKDFPSDISTSSLGYRLRKVNDTSFVFSQFKSLTFFTEAGELTDSFQFGKEIISFAINGKKELAVAFDSSFAVYSPEKNKLWQVVFSEALTSYLLFGPDGKLIHVQYGKSLFNNASFFIRKYSLDGSLVWEKHQTFKPVFVLVTSDSSYFITGQSASSSLTIKKVNQDGVIKQFFSPDIPNYMFVNSQCRLTWSGNYISAVNIYLSIDSAKTWALLGENISEKSFWWLTPSAASNNCFIKLVDFNDPRYFIISSQFAINSNSSFNLQTIETNNLLYYFSKDGFGAYDPQNGRGGLYWPKSSGVTAVFQDGFLWAGKVNGQIRANGSGYRTGLVPGTINPDGTQTDTANSKFKIWKIRRDYEQLPDSLKIPYEHQYLNWPGELGAPFVDANHDGIFNTGIDKPYFIGDETAFFVANDLDIVQSHFFAGTNPIGIEMQQTLYTYKTNDYLDNIVFKNIRIINKSTNTVDSMYIGHFTDVDLGEANDDYAGCDSSTNLGYVFNATNFDSSYGSAPPATGYQFLKGVLTKGNETDSAYVDGTWKKGFKDLGLSAYVPMFCCYTFAPAYFQQGVPEGTKELHNLLSGKLNNGMPFINPNTSQPFGNYPFSGDPETQTGVYEGGPLGLPTNGGDRYLIISSGPFTFAPGDTQNISVAIFLARGTSNVNSVTKLKETAKLIQNFYNKYLTDVKDEKPNTLPSEFALSQNYPNPFNPETVISYQVPVNSKVSLKVYDILGKEVAILVNEEKSAGKYQVNFNGSNLASGVYFYKLSANGGAGSFSQTRKFVLIK
jgi:hypothetical protein